MSERAFVDVDTQVDFVEPGGNLYSPGAEAIKDNLSRLIRHSREQGVALVSCVDAHPQDDPEFKDWPPHAVVGTPGQEKVAESSSKGMVFVKSAPDQALPSPSEHVVLEKQTFSVFSNPNAEAAFAATGAETFVVFGVVTEVCVKHAVLGLLERGYAVEIVEDAIWPITAAGGKEALSEMSGRGARLVRTADVLAHDTVSP
jgi:nicotinamidase/pyrazinamidase